MQSSGLLIPFRDKLGSDQSARVVSTLLLTDSRGVKSLCVGRNFSLYIVLNNISIYEGEWLVLNKTYHCTEQIFSGGGTLKIKLPM
jgi:hypothetical protein